jgi:hypothetical protein
MHQRAELAGQFPQLAKLLKLLFLQATRQRCSQAVASCA